MRKYIFIILIFITTCTYASVKVYDPGSNGSEVVGDLTVDTTTLFVDASENKVGIGDITPSYELDVNGSAKVTSQVLAGGVDDPQTSSGYDLSDAEFVYKCNDTTGTNVEDATTNDNDGTATFEISSYTDTGRVNAGFDLLSNRCVEFPDLGIFDGDEDFTVAFWVKFDTEASSMGLFFPESERNWDIYFNPSGNKKIRVRNWDGATNDTILTSSSAFTTATWYLVIFSYDANSVDYLYVNNSEEASGTMQDDPGAGSTTNYIGCKFDQSTGVDGIIDIAGVWNRVLTSNERTTLWNSGSGTETLFVSSSASVHAIGTTDFTIPSTATDDLNTLSVEGDVTAGDDLIAGDDLVTGDDATVGDDLLVNGLITAGTLYTLPTAVPYKKYVLGSVSDDDETYWKPINEENPPVSKWDDESLTSIGLFTDLHVPNYGVHTYSEAIYQTIVDGINDFQPDFTVELGDYMDGSPDNLPAHYVREWTQGERVWVNLQSPSHHIIGNHEIYGFGSSDSQYDEALAYWLNLTNRTVPYWYDDYNGIRFIFLATVYKNNSSDDWTDAGYIGSTQKTWFEALIDATSTATPIVMITHHPITYASMQDVQDKLEAFETGGGTVIVCLAGHKHDNDLTTENGIDYIRFMRPTSSTATYSKITIDPDDVDGDGDYYYVVGEGGQTDYNGAPPRKSLAVYNGDFNGSVDIEGSAVVKGTPASGLTVSNALLTVTQNDIKVPNGAISVGTSSPSASFRGPGDIYVTSGIKAMEGLYSEAVAYGAGVEIQDNSLVVTYTNAAYGDATLTASTQVIEDTNASFDSTYIGQYLKVIGSSPDFTGATGEIKAVPSSTEIVVSFGTAGADTIPNATGMSFVIYPEPLFFVGDNGDIHAHVGVNEDASFKVCAEDSNNEHVVHFDSISGVDNNRGLEVDHDADGYNIGVAARFNYVSGPLSSGDVGGGLFITMNDTQIVAASATTVLGGIAISTTTASDAVKRGVVILPGFTESFVVQGATAEDPDYASEVTVGVNYDRANGINGDGAAFLESSVSNLTIFDNDNDYILIGMDETFEDIEVNLVSGGGASIRPNFYYSKAGGNWTALPIQGDGTNGFQSGGDIAFNAPADWSKDDEDMNANAIVDAYYVAIQRTRNNLTNKPVEDHFHTFASQDTGAVITGVGAMKPIGKAATPCADTTQFPVGAMFYNSTNNFPCFCNEANVARKMTDSANCY